MATSVLGLKIFTADDPVDYNEINDNYTKIDAGVKTALQGRAAHNLLDNSDFTNPVNQRGATSYTGSVYTIDRWKLSANTLNVGSDGITLVAGDSSSAVITQYISGLRDGVYTQALNVNGTIYTRIIQLSGSTITTIDGSSAAYTGGYVSCVVSSSGDFSFQFRANAGYSITAEWAALYEGSYTPETLPDYVPNGKHIEMLNCNVPLAPHNLLDNSDFTNPVNQRGQSSYSGTGGKVYTIDRWHTWSASISLSLQNGYISITNSTDSIYENIAQIIDGHNLTGKAATIAVWDANGNVYCASGVISTNNEISCNTPTDFWFSAILNDDNTLCFAIRPRGAKTVRLKAAALYEGSYDASTLPAYQHKGYAAELAECQRYFIRIANSTAYGIISGSGCVVKIPLPTTMRKDVVPTISFDANLWVYYHGGYAALTSIGATYSTNTASLHFTVPTSMSACCCTVPDLSCSISADL